MIDPLPAAPPSPPVPAIATRSSARVRRVVRWMRRLVLGFIIAVIFGVSSGLVYQAVAAARDQRNVPPPGQLLDVGGYNLHLHSTGTDRGGPTVIFDAAAGSMSSQWGWIQPQVAEFTQVIAYDRSGQGYSDAPPTPRDIQQHIADLRTALHTAGIIVWVKAPDADAP